MTLVQRIWAIDVFFLSNTFIVIKIPFITKILKTLK